MPAQKSLNSGNFPQLQFPLSIPLLFSSHCSVQHKYLSRLLKIQFFGLVLERDAQRMMQQESSVSSSTGFFPGSQTGKSDTRQHSWSFCVSKRRWAKQLSPCTTDVSSLGDLGLQRSWPAAPVIGVLATALGPSGFAHSQAASRQESARCVLWPPGGLIGDWPGP